MSASIPLDPAISSNDTHTHAHAHAHNVTSNPELLPQISTVPPPTTTSTTTNTTTKPKSSTKSKPKPSTKPNSHGNRHTVAQRAQVLTLAAEKYGIKDIQEITGVPRRTIFTIVSRAKKRGFDYAVDTRVLERYLVSLKPPGRPKKDKEKDRKDGGNEGNGEATRVEGEEMGEGSL